MLYDKALQEDILSILSLRPISKEVSDAFVKSLYELFVSTPSPNIENTAYKLMKNIIEQGKKLSGITLAQLAKYKNYKLSIPLIKEISKNQDLPKDLLLIKNLMSPISLTYEQLSQLLDDLYNRVQNGLVLDEVLLEELFAKQQATINSNNTFLSKANSYMKKFIPFIK